MKIVNLEGEIWKDIEGWEGLYQVSNMGRVKSLPRYRNCIHPYITKEHILSPRWVGKRGNTYLAVRLCFECNKKNEKIHRLVAKAFCENKNNYTEVNHIDENKHNNRSDNLEWCSRSYNVNYGERIRKQRAKVIEPVIQLTLDGEYINEYPSFIDAAKAVNGCPANISHCVNGDIEKYKGYRWIRKEEPKRRAKG